MASIVLLIRGLNQRTNFQQLEIQTLDCRRQYGAANFCSFYRTKYFLRLFVYHVKLIFV